MERIIECVPNFSEGRNREVIDKIVSTIEKSGGVKVLDVDPGEATNRTVVTFIGSPECVVEAAFKGVQCAGELIDMRQHHGAHPRSGATDVLPLIPVAGITLEECAELARRLAERIYTELGIPCYCYEAAAFRPERKNLAVCRSGEYEALPEKIEDPARRPDFGPEHFTEKAAVSGATNVGARDFLIAVNFNLNTTSTRRANAVAFDVREKGRPAREGNPITGKIRKDENGNKRTVEEQVVVYWSRKFQLRAERENKKFLEFLQKLQEHPESFRITAVQSKALRKFFKKECINEKTGEILDSSKIRGFVDFAKVAEYRKSLGYYQIVTSELTMDAQEVINKYHGLTQIEDQFRIMKGDLNTRPLYVRTPEHVTAHLLICMISLILLRIIQKKLKDSGVIQPDPDTYWSGGMSAARIQTALNKWKVDTLPSDLYRFMDVDDPDLKRILDAFRIRIPAKLYRRAELKHIKTEIEVFM